MIVAVKEKLEASPVIPHKQATFVVADMPHLIDILKPVAHGALSEVPPLSPIEMAVTFPDVVPEETLNSPLPVELEMSPTVEPVPVR